MFGLCVIVQEDNKHKQPDKSMMNLTKRYKDRQTRLLRLNDIHCVLDKRGSSSTGSGYIK